MGALPNYLSKQSLSEILICNSDKKNIAKFEKSVEIRRTKYQLTGVKYVKNKKKSWLHFPVNYKKNL